MAEPNVQSPLDLIRQKERELAQHIREAEEKGGQQLNQARQQAAEIRVAAESAGNGEAEKVFQQGLNLVEKEAAEIEAAGRAQAEQVRRRGCKLRERAARTVLEYVIPN